MTSTKTATVDSAGHAGENTGTAFPERTIDRLLAEDLAGNHLTTLLLHTLKKYALARFQGLEYFQGTFLQITWKCDDGAEFTIRDGGAVPWVGAMRSNKRDRFVATGVGAELIPRMFYG